MNAPYFKRLLRELAAILLLAALPAAISGAMQLRWKPTEQLASGEIRIGTAQMWGDRVMWVDARSSAKYAASHIPSAVSLNPDEWDALVPAFLDAWDPDKTIVIYDDTKSADASHALGERLRRELQVESVYILKGGWAAWQSK